MVYRGHGRRDAGGYEHLLSGRFLIEDGWVYLKMTANDFYCFNATTGGQRWHNPNAGGNCSELVLHEGYLYYTCLGDSKLWAVSAASGATEWSRLPPSLEYDGLDASFGASGVGIDHNKDRLYTADRVYVYAMETIK